MAPLHRRTAAQADLDVRQSRHRAHRLTVVTQGDGYDEPPGAVAEWLGRGLQSLVQRFESARRLVSCGFEPGFPSRGSERALPPTAVLEPPPWDPTSRIWRLVATVRAVTRRTYRCSSSRRWRSLFSVEGQLRRSTSRMASWSASVNGASMVICRSSASAILSAVAGNPSVRRISERSRATEGSSRTPTIRMRSTLQDRRRQRRGSGRSETLETAGQDFCRYAYPRSGELT